MTRIELEGDAMSSDKQHNSFGAAWEERGYLASVSDEIVSFEIADARDRIAHCRGSERNYELTREKAWLAESQRRSIKP